MRSPGLTAAAAMIAASLAIGALAPADALACGGETDCAIGDRSYRIVLPDGRDDAATIGAVIYVHGYRGQAARVMTNKRLTGLANAFGVAFIAAQAAGPEWNIPGIPSHDARPGVDELAYFDRLVDDAATRFNLDRSRVVVTGFSSGAMMVWHLACYRGTSLAGFVPMSGTFWEPIPETCPTGPVNLIHYHGDKDPVVPMAGRPIKDARQGNVSEAIAMMVRTGRYRPRDGDETAGLTCSRWTDMAAHRLEFCLFGGKHSMRVEHIERALRLFLNG